MLQTVRQHSRKPKTVEQMIKQREQMALKVLQDCKQISKGDRLQLRKHIKNNCSHVMDMFKAYKQNNNIGLLQVSLRRHIENLKEAKRQEMIKEYKRSVSNSIKNKVTERSKIKIIDKADKSALKSLQRSQKVSESIKQNEKHVKFSSPNITERPKSPRRNPLKQKNTNQLSKSQKQHIQRLLGKTESSGFLSKTLMGTNSSCHLTNEFQERDLDERSNGQNIPPPFKQINFYKTQMQFNSKQLKTQTNAPQAYSSVPTASKQMFTDPKILQECRQIIYQSTTPFTTYTSEVPYLTTPSKFMSLDVSRLMVIEPRLVFGSREAEEVADQIFNPQNELGKSSFIYRLDQFVKQAAPMYGYTTESIQSFFHLLSDNGITIDIGRFGKVLDQFCLKKVPVSDVRRIFQHIDVNRYGCLGRLAVPDEKWALVFDRADVAKRGYVGYWQLYGIRQSWEYLSFSIWYSQANGLNTSQI